MQHPRRDGRGLADRRQRRLRFVRRPSRHCPLSPIGTASVLGNLRSIRTFTWCRLSATSDRPPPRFAHSPRMPARRGYLRANASISAALVPTSRGGIDLFSLCARSASHQSRRPLGARGRTYRTRRRGADPSSGGGCLGRVLGAGSVAANANTVALSN
jgi:hypothetical protein